MYSDSDIINGHCCFPAAQKEMCSQRNPMRSMSQMTANSTASSIQISDSFFQPPPTPISRDTTPNTTKEEGSARYSLDLRDFSNAAADFEVGDCGFDDRSAHRLRGSIIIPIRPTFTLETTIQMDNCSFRTQIQAKLNILTNFSMNHCSFRARIQTNHCRKGG